MKHLVFGFLAFLCLSGFAQNCKPDLEKTDKISRQKNIAWQATIYESGLGNSLVNTSDWFISMQLGRYGTDNLFTIFVNKYEESSQNAAFESPYQGQQGQDIYLAFTQGEPVKLTIQSASTMSKMDNMLGKLVTTIQLGINLSPEQIETLKKAFEGGTLSVIRINLANNMKIEKDIKEKKAKKMAEKLQCFLDYNAKNPTSENTATALPQVSNDIPENLPRNSAGKITFEETVAIDSATKDQLYSRARNWMTTYYKSDKFSVSNQADGELVHDGSFLKSYKMPGGGLESNNHVYTVSISVKDGKYKYSLTDISIEDKRQKMPIEDAYSLIEMLGDKKYKRYVDQQVYSGFADAIKSLKAAMAADIKSKSDW